jgi:hypothetical protein
MAHITSHHITPEDAAWPSHAIASHRIPSHPIPSHPIPSHPIPSHLVSSRLIPSHLISSHPIPSHLIPSHVWQVGADQSRPWEMVGGVGFDKPKKVRHALSTPLLTSPNMASAHTLRPPHPSPLTCPHLSYYGRCASHPLTHLLSPPVLKWSSNMVRIWQVREPLYIPPTQRLDLNSASPEALTVAEEFNDRCATAIRTEGLATAATAIRIEGLLSQQGNAAAEPRVCHCRAMPLLSPVFATAGQCRC